MFNSITKFKFSHDKLFFFQNPESHTTVVIQQAPVGYNGQTHTTTVGPNNEPPAYKNWWMQLKGTRLRYHFNVYHFAADDNSTISTRQKPANGHQKYVLLWKSLLWSSFDSKIQIFFLNTTFVVNQKRDKFEVYNLKTINCIICGFAFDVGCPTTGFLWTSELFLLLTSNRYMNFEINFRKIYFLAMSHSWCFIFWHIFPFASDISFEWHLMHRELIFWLTELRL